LFNEPASGYLTSAAQRTLRAIIENNSVECLGGEAEFGAFTAEALRTRREEKINFILPPLYLRFVERFEQSTAVERLKRLERASVLNSHDHGFCPDTR